MPSETTFEDIDSILLTVDELESIRLADMEGFYQKEAAEYMNTSRQTFARIIDKAHGKVATALVNGLPLRIEGGNIRFCGEDQGCSVSRSKYKCWKEKRSAPKL